MLFRETILYRKAVALSVDVHTITKSLPRGHSPIADQLKRASTSIVLNFAEGYSRATKKERRRFFDIARGSTFEVAAGLDVLQAIGAIDVDTWQAATDKAEQLSRMLWAFK